MDEEINKDEIFLKYLKREEGKGQTREEAILQGKSTLEFHISVLKYKIGELQKELDFMISMIP